MLSAVLLPAPDRALPAVLSVLTLLDVKPVLEPTALDEVELEVGNAVEALFISAGIRATDRAWVEVVLRLGKAGTEADAAARLADTVGGMDRPRVLGSTIRLLGDEGSMDSLTRPDAGAAGLEDGKGRRLFVALVASLPNSRDAVVEGCDRLVAEDEPCLGRAAVRDTVDVGLNVVGRLIGGRVVVEGGGTVGIVRGAMLNRALPTVLDGNALGRRGLAVALAGADIFEGEIVGGRGCGSVKSLAEEGFNAEALSRSIVCVADRWVSAAFVCSIRGVGRFRIL